MSGRIGIVGHSQFYANGDLDNNNAGFHNSLYRGKNLGNAVSAEQYAQIAAGTFDDMFVGDYWKITYNNTDRIFRIAAFDYWLRCGDKNWNDGSGASDPYKLSYDTTHHVVLVPDASLVSAKMNSSNITTGAYIGSGFYTGTNEDESANTAKATAEGIVSGSFGAAHVLNHRTYLQNAVSNGYESAGAWYDSTVDLMNEKMVYGCDIFHNKMHGTNVPNNYTIDKCQLPLFRLDPSKICIRASWWLRDVVSASNFALVNNYGGATYYNASTSRGVRPAFGIKA